jgi:hypothetical protein
MSDRQGRLVATSDQQRIAQKGADRGKQKL